MANLHVLTIRGISHHDKQLVFIITYTSTALEDIHRKQQSIYLELKKPKIGVGHYLLKLPNLPVSAPI